VQAPSIAVTTSSSSNKELPVYSSSPKTGGFMAPKPGMLFHDTSFLCLFSYLSMTAAAPTLTSMTMTSSTGSGRAAQLGSTMSQDTMMDKTRLQPGLTIAEGYFGEKCACLDTVGLVLALS